MSAHKNDTNMKMGQKLGHKYAKRLTKGLTDKNKTNNDRANKVT